MAGQGEITYYNRDGEVTNEEKDSFIYIKDKTYFVKEFKGELLQKSDLVRSPDKIRLKWRKVGPICFRNYLKYLSTNQMYPYNIANRDWNQ